MKRKPSPVWKGVEQDGDRDEMADTVGQVWGLAREVVERDVAVLLAAESLDQVARGSCRAGKG